MKYVLLGNWINTRNVLDGRSQVEYIVCRLCLQVQIPSGLRKLCDY